MNTTPSIALIASREIEEGEELLLDYRLNTKGDLPEWYSVVDEEESSRRWS